MAGDRTLRSTVILSGAEGDPPLVLLAGTTPTAEQAKRIDNPKAWDDYDPDKAERSPVTRPAPLVADESGKVTDPSEPPAGDGPPAKSAVKAEWQKYADSIGVTVDKKNPTKKDYQDAVKKAAK